MMGDDSKNDSYIDDSIIFYIDDSGIFLGLDCQRTPEVITRILLVKIPTNHGVWFKHHPPCWSNHHPCWLDEDVCWLMSLWVVDVSSPFFVRSIPIFVD